MENQSDSNPFDVWNQRKQQINAKDSTIFFREKEVWWCSLGINIAAEENGSGGDFERPVVLLAKFSQSVVCIVPLTTTIKDSRFYVELFSLPRKSCAIISQIRAISPKRLIRKMNVISDEDYGRISDAVGRLLIKSKPPSADGGISEPPGLCDFIIIPPFKE